MLVRVCAIPHDFLVCVARAPGGRCTVALSTNRLGSRFLSSFGHRVARHKGEPVCCSYVTSTNASSCIQLFLSSRSASSGGQCRTCALHIQQLFSLIRSSDKSCHGLTCTHAGEDGSTSEHQITSPVGIIQVTSCTTFVCCASDLHYFADVTRPLQMFPPTTDTL